MQEQLIIFSLFALLVTASADGSLKPSFRVYLGRTIEENEFPFYVFWSLVWKGRNTGYSSCGAAAISSHWYITTASCVYDWDPEWTEKSLEMYHLTSDDTRNETIYITDQIIYPGWVPSVVEASFTGDLALFKVDHDLAPKTRPIRLPKPHEEELHMGLLKTNASFVGSGFADSYMTWSAKYKPVFLLRDGTRSPLHFFHEELQPKSFIMNGDIGSPAFHRSQDGDYLLGIMSHLLYRDWKRSEDYVAFASVSALSGWILHLMDKKDNSANWTDIMDAWTFAPNIRLLRPHLILHKSI